MPKIIKRYFKGEQTYMVFITNDLFFTIGKQNRQEI